MAHKDDIMATWHRHGAREAWLTARTLAGGDEQAAAALVAELDAPKHVRRGILAYSAIEADAAVLAEAGLAGQIARAIRDLELRRAEHEARWSRCLRAARLALAAAERGERAEALRLVEKAADDEYGLCGDCDSLGKVEDGGGR